MRISPYCDTEYSERTAARAVCARLRRSTGGTLDNNTSAGGRLVGRRDLLRGIGAGTLLFGGGSLLTACGPSSTPSPSGSAAATTGSASGGTLQAAIYAEPNFINPADALEL